MINAKKVRERIRCVVDSWSDDETADYLRIGLRHVRRLAQGGTLYYFLVGKKRRYPVWQFGGSRGTLMGTKHLAAMFPKSWRPEDVYGFMTTHTSQLGSATPAQWLLLNRDLSQVARLIEAGGHGRSLRADRVSP